MGQMKSEVINTAAMASLILLCAVTAAAAEWTRFRGPNGTGISESGGLPIEFGAQNRAWEIKTDAGSSSPIIAGGRIFLSGYREQERSVWCVDLSNGAKIWERRIQSTRAERKSPPNDAASSTPATDGTNLFVLFSGFGLLSFDWDGHERWRTPLEGFTQPHGMSSSPILAGGNVIVLADQITNSYLAGFDCQNGTLKWKTPRGNFVGGYSTPILFQDSLVVSGPAELVAYSPLNGERRWSASKMGIMPVASPVCVGNRIFLNNGAVPPFESLARDFKADRNGDGKLTPEEFPDPSFREAVLAIDRAYGNGDGAVDKAEWDGALKLMQTLNALVAVEIKDGQPRELWRTTKNLTDVSSPLLYRGVLYLVKDGGILTALNPDDGRVLKQDRIDGAGGRYFASPLAADGRIFTLSEAGKLAVIKAGAQWELLQVNDMGEECYASPALSDHYLVVRGKEHLRAFRF